MLELVLLVALIILVVAVWKPFKRNVLGALDARAERIRAELDEAQRLQEEAKVMLAKYQRQLHEGERLAADIVAQAEAERARLEQKMRADFDAAVKRRTEQAVERIAQEEQKALAEVVGEREAQAMVRGAIEDVSRKLA
jgi:F-type H+-transporting ATPase subunit b